MDRHKTPSTKRHEDNPWYRYYAWRDVQPVGFSLDVALAVLPGFGFSPDDIEDFVEHWDD